MDNETAQELIAAIRTLSHSTQIHCELMETLNAQQSDLISEIKVLRNVIEASSLTE